MKKICVLSLLLSLVSFSKGYVETYGKFYFESNGNNKVDKAGVRLNVEQGKFKFKTNIGFDKFRSEKFKNKEFEKNELEIYGFRTDNYDEYYHYNYNVKHNISNASNASLEYAMIRDEKADATLKAKVKSENFGDIYREYVQLGADVAFKFKGGEKIGLDNKLNCYIEKKQRIRTQNKIYLDFNVSDKANIKTSFGVDYFNEGLKYTDVLGKYAAWGPSNLYFTTGIDVNTKFNENTKINGEFDAITAYDGSLKTYTHLNYFGIGEAENLYEDEEMKYIVSVATITGADSDSQYLVMNLRDFDRMSFPNTLLRAYLNIEHKNGNFKVKVFPFANVLFNNWEMKESNGEIYGINSEISNKFFEKWLLGSKVEIAEYSRKYYFQTKQNKLKLSLYSEFEGKINDKLILIPKIKFEYLNKYVKHRDEHNRYVSSGNGYDFFGYFFQKLMGEVGLSLKYNITNNLIINTEVMTGLKFFKGSCKFIDYDNMKKIEDKQLNEYLKLNFNMKYEWK